MANQVTFKEVLDQINDYGQNYTATTIDKGNVKRAANRAFEHVQSRLGLPSDIDTFDFEYYQDTNLYDCPDDFNELIQLYYNTDQSDITVDLNTPAHRWNIAKDTEILRSTGSRNVNSGYQWNGPSSNQVALTRINGKNQLLLKGSNSNGIQLINSFDTTTGLTFSSDIANQAADSNVKKQGNASIKFDITAGQTSSSISMTGNWNIQNSITNVAFTRAMDNLTLSFVHSRFYKGKRTQLNKSRFLVESGLVKGSLVIEKTSGFKKGDMVSHKIFGQGRVEKAVNAGKDYKLTINFGGQKRDILSSFVEKN